MAIFVYFTVNSITAGTFVTQFIKANFDLASQNFIPVLNIVLFVLFSVNIILIIFLGTARYDQSAIKILLRYPISLKQIIFFRTLAVSAEVINILFLPLYIAAYFIAGNSFNFTSVTLFLFILMSFLFCINSIIESLRNLTSAIISLNKFKFFFWSFSAFLMTAFVLMLSKIPAFFSDEQSIKKFSEILFCLPTGIFTESLFALKEQINISQIFFYVLYLILFSTILYAINLALVKFYKNRDFGKKETKKKFKIPVISKLLGKTSLGPFAKKNIYYFYRSPRRLINILAIIGYEIWLMFIVTVKIQTKGSHDSHIISCLTILFESGLIFANAGNFFAFDYSGIINYFFRPLKTENLIKSKILITNLLVMFNGLVFIYFVFLLRINIYDVLLQINILVFVYFVSLFVAVLLSFYFPKEVGFYAIMGMNAPFPAVLISILISLGFWGADYFLLAKINSVRNELIITFVTFLFNIAFLYYRKSSYVFFDKILINRKENIIDKLK